MVNSNSSECSWGDVERQQCLVGMAMLNALVLFRPSDSCSGSRKEAIHKFNEFDGEDGACCQLRGTQQLWSWAQDYASCSLARAQSSQKTLLRHFLALIVRFLK
eukprot:gnl/MRDRNA2_/MRDRNA2_80937_c0_seq1.p1 gnl/MRDRNA2_/MRDRNA2_80937_c0~~gnl/MRDRNA2_/MRDRNA2_80937_c0_seq1.p1  ORF type:complete len:104 (+),score=13.84 gnl/MRDRNA2_/MRDRNA2_80937_c0_seq1:93-404(+)